MHSPSTSDAPTKAFATQYTSLILILLTFVLGAFTAPAPSGNGYVSASVSPRSAPFGIMVYDDVFGERDDVQGNVIEPLIIVLSTHDVRVRMTVLAPAGQLSRALKRVQTLQRYLFAQGVPNDALTFEAKTAERGALAVEFLTEER